MTQTTVDSYFKQILRDWVQNGRFPDTTVEACTPSLAGKLGTGADAFTFDNFIHSSQTPEWNLKPLDVGKELEATLYVYLPTQWTEIRRVDDASQVLEENSVRQTVYLIDQPNWLKDLDKFFANGEICAFVYYLIQPPEFHQWICLLEEGNRVWVFAFYSAPGKLLVTKADATDKATLELQLTSLINSNPWYGFVKPL